MVETSENLQESKVRCGTRLLTLAKNVFPTLLYNIKKKKILVALQHRKQEMTVLKGMSPWV